jgi:hypothetical protein
MMITRLSIVLLGICVLCLLVIPTIQKAVIHNDDDEVSFSERFSLDDTYAPLRDVIVNTFDAFRKPVVHEVFRKFIPSVKQRQQRMKDDEVVLRNEMVIDPMNQWTTLEQYGSTRRIEATTSDPVVPPVNYCDETTLFASYENITYYCGNGTVTEEEYDILVHDPSNNCSMTNSTVFVCICPLDRSGYGCHNYRHFQCIVGLITPERKCEAPPANEAYGGIDLDGDYPCFKFSMEDHSSFTYNMTCKFTEPAYKDTVQKNLPTNETYTIYLRDGNQTQMTLDEIYESYTYYLNHNYTEIINGTEQVTGTFTLSKPLEQPLRFKVFNFNTLSDISGWFDIPLTDTGYYIGQKHLIYRVKFSELNEELFAGDRLYCEVRIFNVGNLNMPWEKLFIDFTDRKIPIYTNTRMIVLASVIPSVSIIVIVVLLIVIGLYLYKQRRDRLEIKSH